MNIFWPSPASTVISVPPAIRRGWWNSGNGSVPAYFGRFPTGISSSASRRSCAGTFSELVLDLIGEGRSPVIEDREVIQPILKHLGLWLVKSRRTPKAHAPPAGYLRHPFSQLPMNDDHIYRDPDDPCGMLTYSRKDQEYGGEEAVCPDEPQKRLTSLAQWLKAPPSHFYPKNPPKPPLKTPQTNPRSCATILLTPNCLFCIFSQLQSEFLSINLSIQLVFHGLRIYYSDADVNVNAAFHTAYYPSTSTTPAGGPLSFSTSQSMDG